MQRRIRLRTVERLAEQFASRFTMGGEKDKAKQAYDEDVKRQMEESERRARETRRKLVEEERERKEEERKRREEEIKQVGKSLLFIIHSHFYL